MVDTETVTIVESLQQLVSQEANLLSHEKDRMVSLYEQLGFQRAFLIDSKEKRHENEEMQFRELPRLERQIRYAAYEAGFVVNLLILSRSSVLQKEDFPGDICYTGFEPSMMLSTVIAEMESIKSTVIKIFGNKEYNIEVPRKLTDGVSSRSINSVAGDEDLVGFDDEAFTIIDRLLGRQNLHLDIISIVGMAGLGKTSLAKKVYEDPLVEYHFYVRAWVYVSQQYKTRDLLIAILNSSSQHEDKFSDMTTEKLGEQLYKRLKGKRYLIVMDDLWDAAGWDALKSYLPNDNNGSRIMLTSGLKAITLHAKPNSPPHFLKLLTSDESWRLFERKVFHEASCPSELKKTGKEIAEKCGGLPLAIVVLAGLLAKLDKTLDWWKEVAHNVVSYITNDTLCTAIMSLSYSHLPLHLKPCFLYFAVFPEDYEIPVRILTWLWISEGFVKQEADQRSLEDVAEGYLMDLVDRCLVIADKNRCSGGIKVCRIHDLLHDLCLREVKDTYYLSSLTRTDINAQYVFGHYLVDYLSSLTRTDINGQFCRKLTTLCGIPSFLCFSDKVTSLPLEKSPFFRLAFNAKVLDLRSISIRSFPDDITELIQLRYLALQVSHANYLPPSIFKLWNLETLIVVGTLGDISLPYDLLKMAKLRHLYIRERVIFIPRVTKVDNVGDAFVLENLQTISKMRLSSSEEKVLSKTPNLRKLGCEFSVTLDGFNSFPSLSFLVQLETLNLTCTLSQPHEVEFKSIGMSCPRFRFASMDKFPPILRKLTLSKFCLPWAEISTLGKLPNLEVLKLSHNAFKGALWETRCDEFRKLKFLKLQFMDVKQWKTSSDHFPSLQQLLVYDCDQFEKIPSCVGYISTLEVIDLRWPKDSAAYSVTKISEEQKNINNDGLKIFVYPPSGARRFEEQDNWYIHNSFGI